MNKKASQSASGESEKYELPGGNIYLETGEKELTYMSTDASLSNIRAASLNKLIEKATSTTDYGKIYPSSL